MNWQPANAIVGPYLFKNYGASINITGGTRNNTFNNIVRRAVNMGQRLGSKSSYGSVVPIGADGKYVMKTMRFTDDNGDDRLKIFLNEIRVGSMPGISEVGPKIYAWRIIRDSSGVATRGQYIMDSFTKGDPKLSAQTSSEYLKNFNDDSCPQEYFKHLRRTLGKFWKITKGYHGDLHPGNIAVVTDPSGEIKRVLIFDYGSHKKFKKNITKITCFYSFLKIINKEFKSTNNYFPESSRIPVRYRNRGQPIRLNTNMLRGLTPRGVVIVNNFSKSTMSRMGNTTSRVLPANFKNLHNRGLYSHRNAFLKPEIYEKILGYQRPSNAILARYRKYFPVNTNNELRQRIKGILQKTGTLNFPYQNEKLRRAIINNLN
jgi:hypothetical protein